MILLCHPVTLPLSNSFPFVVCNIEAKCKENEIQINENEKELFSMSPIRSVVSFFCRCLNLMNLLHPFNFIALLLCALASVFDVFLLDVKGMNNTEKNLGESRTSSSAIAAVHMSNIDFH